MAYYKQQSVFGGRIKEDLSI